MGQNMKPWWIAEYSGVLRRVAACCGVLLVTGWWCGGGEIIICRGVERAESAPSEPLVLIRPDPWSLIADRPDPPDKVSWNGRWDGRIERIERTGVDSVVNSARRSAVFGASAAERPSQPIPASRCDVGVPLCQLESLSNEPPQPRQV